MQKTIIFIQLFVIFIFPLTVQASNCNQSNYLNNQAYQTNKPSEQKRLLLKALRLCPSNAVAHNNLAVVYENQQSYRQALFHYRQTLKLSPNYFHAWVGIGDVYLLIINNSNCL